MEIYSRVLSTPSFGVEVILLGFFVLLVGLSLQSETFERLVVSRVRGPLYLAYGTYGLPSLLLLLEVQRTRPVAKFAPRTQLKAHSQLTLS